jgi:hypothetical protein
LLDFAIRASPWRPAPLETYAGWRAGAADPLNRMATIADEIGDWLWHKPPWSEMALEYGSQVVAEDVEAGDELGAALKAAYLSHLVIDTLAVSHVWLDLLAEHEDFPDVATLRRLHDPVENAVIEPLEELHLEGEATEEDFAHAYETCKKEATEIARRVVVDYRQGRSTLPHSLGSTRNSARAMGPYLQAVTGGAIDLSRGVDAELRLRRWPGRELLSWDGQRLLDALADRALVSRLKGALGWNGRNIFSEPWGCSAEARRDLWLFRQDRAQWRQRCL